MAQTSTLIDPNVTDLNQIPFSDGFFGARTQVFKGVPGSPWDPVPAPQGVKAEIEELRMQLGQYFEKHKEVFKGSLPSEFSFRHEHRGHMYRVTRFVSVKDVLYVLRRFPVKIPAIGELGLHDEMVRRLMTPRMGGLILVSGAFAQGKTTTASSFVSSRLSKLGGVAVTIEDPCEMPLEGHHGEGEEGGYCYQTEAQRGGFGDSVRMASRISPDIIFLGEIRDSEAAAEAVRAANNGRLVVATIHADQPSSAVERLYSFANAVGSASDDVATAISRGLTAVVHQRLEPLTADSLTLSATMLWLGEYAQQVRDAKRSGAREVSIPAVNVRQLIVQRKWNDLDQEVNRQMSQMLTAPIQR